MPTFHYLLRNCYCLISLFILCFSFDFHLFICLLLYGFLTFIWFFSNICLEIRCVLKNQSLLKHEVVQLRQVWILYLVLLYYMLCCWIIDLKNFSRLFDSDALDFNHVNQASPFNLIYLNIISFFSRVLIFLINFRLFIIFIIFIFWAFLVLCSIQLIVKFFFCLFTNPFFHCFKNWFILILNL
jgi:hypothetical protein